MLETQSNDNYDNNYDPKVIVALDFPSGQAAMNFAKTLDPSQCRLKVGKELFAGAGPQMVKELITLGFDVFLDLKYHDIPNTVAKAVQAAARMGVWMVNVHASGGSKMMKAAKEALKEFDKPPLLIAVTVLTSMQQEDLSEIGLDIDPKEQVLRLAKLTKRAGLDGVVCSALEVNMLRETLGPEFCLVTPGIRPAGSDVNDQKRIMTPKEALAAGSSYLVIGRPITQAENPVQALHEINLSIA